MEAFATEGQAAPESETSECRRQRGDCFEEWFSVDDGAANRAETPPSLIGQTEGSREKAPQTARSGLIEFF